MTTEQLHISIGTYPHSQLTLEQELRLVKAAILYADKVTLYSLQATLISMASELGNVSPQRQLDMLELVGPYFAPELNSEANAQFLARYRQITQRKHLGSQEILLKKKFEAMLRQQWQGIQAMSEKVSTDAGLPQLKYAVKEGVVELHAFKGTTDERSITEFIADCIIMATGSTIVSPFQEKVQHDSDAILHEYIQLVSDAVVGGRTFPLFDEQTGDLVRAGIRERKIQITDVAIKRSKHTPLAASLFQRLPLFEDATVDVVIDIRRELSKPLIRFRRAMIEYSASISSAQWEPDFPAEAELFFYQQVAPTILEIEEAVKSNASLRILLADIARKVLDKPLIIPAGSALSVALSSIANLPVEVAATLALGIPATALIVDAFNEWKQKKDAVERNALYFYYRAQKRIAD